MDSRTFRLGLRLKLRRPRCREEQDSGTCHQAGCYNYKVNVAGIPQSRRDTFGFPNIKSVGVWCWYVHVPEGKKESGWWHMSVLVFWTTLLWVPGSAGSFAPGSGLESLCTASIREEGSGK